MTGTLSTGDGCTATLSGLLDDHEGRQRHVAYIFPDGGGGAVDLLGEASVDFSQFGGFGLVSDCTGAYAVVLRLYRE